MTRIGIVGALAGAIVTDEYQAIIEKAKEYGLEIIVVGHDHDMGSELMRKLIQSGKFQITRQEVGILKRQTHHDRSRGPRDKWGKLK